MTTKKTLKSRLDLAESDLAHCRVKIAELEVRLAKLEQSQGAGAVSDDAFRQAAMLSQSMQALGQRNGFGQQNMYDRSGPLNYLFGGALR